MNLGKIANWTTRLTEGERGITEGMAYSAKKEKSL
jgi:hypothetical protein